MISRMIGSNRYLCLASAVTLCSASFVAAQAGQEVAFAIPDAADITSIDVAECSYLAPSATGAELIFNCPSKIAYSVTYQETGTPNSVAVFGHVRLRPTAVKNNPMIAPLLLVDAYSATLAGAVVGFNALAEHEKPTEVLGAEVPAPPAVAPTPRKLGASVIQSDAAPSVSNDRIEVSWNAAYGTIKLLSKDGVTLEEIEEVNGQIKGALTVPTDFASTITLGAEHSSNCTSDFKIEELRTSKDITFACVAQTVAVPFDLPVSGGDCRATSNGFVACLTPTSQNRLTVALENWKPLEIETKNGKAEKPISLKQLAPDFPSQGVIGQLQAIATDRCTPRNMEMSVTAYCLNDLCTPIDPKAQQPIDSSGFLMNLDAAGWDKKRLPTGVKLALTAVSGTTRTVAREEVVAFPASLDAMTAFVKKGSLINDVRLTLDVDPSVYKLDRSVRVFYDDICAKEVAGKSVNLSNPGNKVPDVPVCSYYRVFDGEKSRSSCKKASFNTQTQTLSAKISVEDCGDKRLVVLVSESSKMNGRLGKTIANSLRNLAQDLNKDKACTPVDIVHAADERREVMLSAEDIHFAKTPADLSTEIDMSFVASGTEVLRDFEWVNRRWNGKMGGLIAIIDGETTRPGSMVESPASMAWKINNHYRSILDVSKVKNCDVFKNVLLFDKCEQTNSDTLEAQLMSNIKSGLKALGQ